MSPPRAVIDASEAPSRLLTSPVLGVPLVLWSFAALRRVLPPGDVALVASDAPLMALASTRGLHALGPRAREGTLVIDPLAPFLRQETLEPALKAETPRIDPDHRSAIERLRVDSDEALELVRATARGLPPSDPHVAGVPAMRIPSPEPIEAMVSDVDGVLTDGGIFYMDQPEAGRIFNTHDGMGVKRLREAGIKVAWLSATTSGASIERRATQLGVDLVDAGSGDKGPRFEAICTALGVEPERVLYLGDDVNDLPAIARAGVSACPRDAQPEVANRVDLILDTEGGRGAFREAAEIILASRALA